MRARRYPPTSPTSSTRAAARRVHDRQPARHRLDDERRARVLHLRVQQHVRAPKDARRVALRVPADAGGRARRGRARRRSGSSGLTSRPVTRSCASGRLRAKRRERPERELEPVLLRLIAAEEEHRPAAGGGVRRGEVRDVDRVVEDLPGPVAARRGSSSAERFENSLWYTTWSAARTARRSGSLSSSVRSPAQPGYATPSWLTTIGAPRRRAIRSSGPRSRGSHVVPR